MFNTRIASLLLALCCLLGLGGSVLAAEVDCDDIYCFQSGDFSEDEKLAGICITELPDAQTGTVWLGSRILREGDILTADQLAQMTFAPLRTEEDQYATVTYLPIYADRVEAGTTMTIAIRGKEDKAPVAEDTTAETYKNLSAEGTLKVNDPEGESLTYTVVRQPRRGEVAINADGTFTYTPKKNKVGTDSFTFTAADPAGNVSREATVTIQIIKPTNAARYTDTAGNSCRFAAEWLRQTGIFEAENIGGEGCFYPEKEVSQGEFLAMVIKTLNVPMEDTALSSVPADTPMWLKPYVAAAIRAGLTANLSAEFDADAPISAETAAILLQNALDLEVITETESDEVPVWAEAALTAMAQGGIHLPAGENLTRADAAMALYQVSKLSDLAPGMQILRMQ
jgi:VCBS repeat-containing protein